MQAIKQILVFTILVVTILVFNFNALAFAEIISFSTDKSMYSLDEQIIFSGTIVNHEELVNILAMNPRGDLQTILKEASNDEGSFEFVFNPSDLFAIKGIYKIAVHTTDQPVYDGKFLLFEFSGSAIKVVNPEPKPEYSGEPYQALPPNCVEIKTEKLTTVICEDTEDGDQLQVEQNAIPQWVKQTSLWWNQGNSSDKEFISSISFLILEKIISIPDFSPSEQTEESVPSWVKHTAGWWAEDEISEEEFVNAIKYLVEKQVIKI